MNVVVLSIASRRRGTDLDLKRMDEIDDQSFLIWKPPHSGDDMDILQLAYKPDAYYVSIDYYVHKIKNQLENNQYVLKNVLLERDVGFTIVGYKLFLDPSPLTRMNI